MSARTSEVIQIKSPIKKQIQHLDGESQSSFPELLNNVVRRLRKNGYKLIHVTKSYKKKGAIRSDNFWRKETRIKNIKIVWFCTLTIIFEKGYKFKFDFDFWFEYSKYLQNLRSDLYQRGFPYTERNYAKNFGKKEAGRALEKIKESISQMVKSKVDGWGEHGIKKEVLKRKSLDICHRKEISISSLSELEKIRGYLGELTENPIEIVKNSRKEIDKVAQEKLDDLIPFSIKPDTLEGFLAFFLWFRKPGGGFEYQLYRFIQENYGKIVRKEEIRDALLRLEVHRYANVKEVPNPVGLKLEEENIPRCRRFYEIGEKDVPGKKLFRELKKKANIGAYLAPLPRKRLIRNIDAPNHIVDKKIKKLTRKNFFSKRKVKDYLGRTVRKIKPIRNPRKLSGLERRIAEQAEKFYNLQKKSLDEIQEGRPQS